MKAKNIFLGLFTILTLALGLVLAGCGDGSGSGPTPPPPAPNGTDPGASNPGGTLSGRYYREDTDALYIEFNSPGTYTWMNTDTSITWTDQYTALGDEVTLERNGTTWLSLKFYYNSSTLYSGGSDISFYTFYLKDDGTSYRISGTYSGTGSTLVFDSDGFCTYGTGAATKHSYAISGRTVTITPGYHSLERWAIIDSNTLKSGRFWLFKVD